MWLLRWYARSMRLLLPAAAMALSLYLSLDPRSADDRQFVNIPRISENMLSAGEFERYYLTAGVPVIIVPESVNRNHATNNDNGTVVARLLRHCGDRHIQPNSRTTETVLNSMDPEMRYILEAAVGWQTGRPFQRWLESRRKTTVRQMYEIAKEEPPTVPLSVRMARRIPLIGQFVPFLEVALRPPYVSDVLASQMNCSEVLIASGATSYERFITEKLGEREPPPWNGMLSELVFENATKFSWGGRGTASYPLHRDLCDADAFFTTLHGCKEFIIVRPEQHRHFARVAVSGIAVWADALFDVGRPTHVERDAAWQGTVHAGETLFMPGEALHFVRNSCANTLAACRRPWRASAVRNISIVSREIFEYAPPFSYVYSNLRAWFQSASKSNATSGRSLLRNLDFRIAPVCQRTNEEGGGASHAEPGCAAAPALNAGGHPGMPDRGRSMGAGSPASGTIDPTGLS